MPLSSIDDAERDDAAPAFHARMRHKELFDAIGHCTGAPRRRHADRYQRRRRDGRRPPDMFDCDSRDQLAAFPDGSLAGPSAPEAPLSRGYDI